MADMEKLQTFPIIMEGGLDSNKNHIFLSQKTPGAATSLVNYEPSLYGGYRKIDGFEPLEENYPTVDDVNATGKILLVHIFGTKILTARKLKSGSVYNYYYWTSGADWTGYTTTLSLSSTGVERIRAINYNFQGPNSIIFVDGANGAVLFNGTNWVETSSSATGADFTNAGGDQLVDKPSLATLFKNHLFVAGDPTYPSIVAHSAPAADYDWAFANGAGQINVGFAVKQIKPFRDELYVFGADKIKKIVVDGTDFVLKDVTNNGGLLAADSVVEVNGDLLFLAADGFRTVAATERNNDVELGVASKKIQSDLTNLISNSDLNSVQATVVRRKSQVRFFFSDENIETSKNQGILGGLRGDPESTYWEWGLIRGIKVSAVTSGYINNQEYVLHGDFSGRIYRQERGDSFDGETIFTLYSTPFLDFGDAYYRKTLHKVMIFLRPEGSVELNMGIKFDWGSTAVSNPSNYDLEAETTGEAYGTAIYGTSKYALAPPPLLVQNIEGSFFSSSLIFTSNDTNGSYSIQAILFEYSVNGRK